MKNGIAQAFEKFMGSEPEKYLSTCLDLDLELTEEGNFFVNESIGEQNILNSLVLKLPRLSQVDLELSYYRNVLEQIESEFNKLFYNS